MEGFAAAPYSRKWLIMDDLAVDFISTFIVVAAAIASYCMPSNIKYILGATAIILAPLRAVYPVRKVPKGTALITGASEGIGAQLAYIFASKGNDLILVGRELEHLENVKAKITSQWPQRKVTTISKELSLESSAQDLYDEIKSRGLTVDILCNNAGAGHAGDVMAIPPEVYMRMIGVNCTTLVALTQLYGRDMIRRGSGWILQTSSIAGWVPGPNQSVYHATKHFVRSFNEALYMELRGTGVTLTQLMPGPVDTQFGARAHMQNTGFFGPAPWLVLEDPRVVALSGYNGLCRQKRMVFSTWTTAVQGVIGHHFLPRCISILLGQVLNMPTPWEHRAPAKE